MDPEELLAHINFVRALARSLVQDVHTAADIEQQTWLAALEHPPRDRKSLRSWLSRVALNFARRMYWADKKRRKLESAYQDNGSVTSPDQIVEREELRRRLIESGEFYIVSTKINGVGASRVTIINPLTTVDHLQSLFESLRRHGQVLLAESRDGLPSRH